MIAREMGDAVGFKDWFRRRRQRAQAANEAIVPPTTSRPVYPWDVHPSIYEHLRAHVIAGRPGLSPDGQTLPDESSEPSNQIRWAPGALDGVMSHHMAPPDDQDQRLLELIRQYCRTPTAAKKLEVYEAIRNNDVLHEIDGLLDVLGETQGLDHRRLYELARSFATESPDRGPVKIGVAILGRFRMKQDIELFHLLGRHDEFTLYCAIALANGDVESPEHELWELARQVDGWGRIQIVERLASTEDPRIRAWMVREGFRNSVMNEYLAYTCATAGGLLDELRAESPDEALLTGAGEIIDALLNGGPAQGIQDYADGPAAIEAYLGHLLTRASTLEQFLTVSGIREFVLAPATMEGTDEEEAGWTPVVRQRVTERCNQALCQPRWRELAGNNLASSDDQVYSVASRAAEKLGIDVWPSTWARLQQSPLNPGRWFDAMRQCDDQRIAGIVELAERTLPLDRIATGPGDQLGLGPEFNVHSCLDFIVQDLNRFPGHGMKLIESALRSPVVRNRAMALRALAGWGREQWPQSAADALRVALEREPEESIAKSMRRVLDGRPLDEQD